MYMTIPHCTNRASLLCILMHPVLSTGVNGKKKWARIADDQLSKARSSRSRRGDMAMI